MPFVVLALAYRPDGEQLAVACLNAQITFWTVKHCTQTGSIEGRHDLGYARKDTDKISGKKATAAKYVVTLHLLMIVYVRLAAVAVTDDMQTHFIVEIVENPLIVSRAFNTLCYTADGKCLMAAGQSKNVSIYSVEDQILMKQLEITRNQSLDGTMVRFR